MSLVSHSLQIYVPTNQSVVLAADVFQLFTKHAWFQGEIILCTTAAVNCCTNSLPVSVAFDLAIAVRPLYARWGNNEELHVAVQNTSSAR